MNRFSYSDLSDRIVELELKLHNVVVRAYKYGDEGISLYLCEIGSGKSYTLKLDWEEMNNLDVVAETIRLQALF